jgi:hypothetical protein
MAIIAWIAAALGLARFLSEPVVTVGRICKPSTSSVSPAPDPPDAEEED